MLQAITCASPPALRMPSATSSQASALRLEITTLAPSLANSSAEDRPMPRLEPVMTATLPVRSNGVFFKVCLLRRHSSRHCERSEAIHLAAERRNGLLRRFAPRNDDSHSSFRDGPKDQTRNLEIPGSMLRIVPERRGQPHGPRPPPRMTVE